MPVSGHRILLVEDEAIIPLDLKAIIRKANGEVVAHGANLAKALKLANTPSGRDAGANGDLYQA